MKEIELISKRGKREKHFLQKNGEIKALLYSEDIHFKRNGKYEEIDNTLVKNKGYYKNRNNSYKVQFEEESKSNLMEFQLDKDYIKFDLVNKNKVEVNIENIMAEYKDIIQNTDIRYELLPNKVKESIVLKDKENIEDIEFTYETNLELKLNKNKTISALKDKEEIFIIEAPYMIDKEGKINTNISYILENNTLKIDLDKEWLGEAVYPVTIDPTISLKDKGIQNTYIYKGDTNDVRYNTGVINVGTERVKIYG